LRAGGLVLRFIGGSKEIVNEIPASS